MLADYYQVPRSDAARIVLGATWLAFVILTATYSGKLVASFAIQKKKVS